MSSEPWQPRRDSLVVMLDWENFPGIRPSHEQLPLDRILSFLRGYFEIEIMIAYAHRATLSVSWEKRLQAAGFEVRLLDGLIDANDKKNSLDLCLAMDAVRLAYTTRPAAFALLVAGDKDFAVVAAFVRHRLERRAIAFGSLYCPNPTLADEVDRYFVLEQVDDWPRQLVEGNGRYVSRPFSAAVRRRAEVQRPFVVAGLAELGPDTPCPLGLLTPAIRRRHPEYQTRGELRLSTVVEALGCQLSPDRQQVVAWAQDLLDAARTRAGAGWIIPETAQSQRFVADRARLSQLAECVRDGFAALGPALRFPLPLSVVHSAVFLVRPEVRKLLSKRLRLWHVLSDLGFELSPDHTAVLRAAGDVARALLGSVGTPQLQLFVAGLDLEEQPAGLIAESPEASAGSAPIAAATAVDLAAPALPMLIAAEDLARRVRARRRTLPLGPLFASLTEQPRQQWLPFEAG